MFTQYTVVHNIHRHIRHAYRPVLGIGAYLEEVPEGGVLAGVRDVRQREERQQLLVSSQLFALVLQVIPAPRVEWPDGQFTETTPIIIYIYIAFAL